MELLRLRKWQNRCLTAIEEYKAENLVIIYLDETWFETHDTKKKDEMILKKCQIKASCNLYVDFC